MFDTEADARAVAADAAEVFGPEEGTEAPPIAGKGAVDGIPAGLDEMAPGPVLAGWLAAIDVEGLSGYDRVVVLRAHQRLASHYVAQVYRDMGAVADAAAQVEDDEEWAATAGVAEVGVALRLTRRAADREMGLSWDIWRRLPQVGERLAAGEIDVRRARVLADGTAHLSDDLARRVVAGIIDQAGRLTTGQLAARLRRSCIEADPDDAELRYREAVAERRVAAHPTPDGTAHLFALHLPPDRVAAAGRHINHLARRLRHPEETRTMDQLRADVLLDLLTGVAAGRPEGGRRGVVDIRVDLDTLTELADHPGELAGYGPVVADIARRSAAEQTGGRWRWTVTDPNTGQPLRRGITRRRPTVGQRRAIETDTPTCIFPGCRMPAGDCDLDHRIPHAEGGPTTTDNLAPLCRHHHRLRHHTAWTHQPLPDGDHQWSTTLGHDYTTSGTPP